MNTQMAWWATLLGLLTLAGTFYLLQRLRVRQRTLVVETTMFWRHALEATRARVLTQRFRHPWVYALLLLIGSLLWLAFAGLQGATRGTHRSLVLIDGSASTAQPERFARGLAQAQALAGSLPAETREVVLCGGTPRTVLAAGEHPRLLQARLAGCRPQACPPSVEAAIRGALLRRDTAPLDIYLAGDAALDAAFLAGLPEDVVLRRLDPGDPPAAPNRGITRLGVRPAASAQWDRVDVLVEVRGGAELALPDPILELGAEALEPGVERQETAGRLHLVYRDLPARGGRLRVRLPADPRDQNPLDEQAEILLPQRRPLRVALAPGLPAVLGEVIAADPALRAVSEQPEVVLRHAGSGFGAGLPALELSAAAAQTNAFQVVYQADEDPEQVVRRLHAELGLGEIDAQDLARKTGRVISMGAAPGPERRLQLWAELLSARYNFVKSRSFPLFVSLGLRWLGDVWAPPAVFAAGDAVELAGVQVQDATGKVLDTLGDRFMAPVAGAYQSDRGPSLAAALLAPGVTAPAAVADPLAAAAVPGVGLDWVTGLLLAALVLLLVDWFLYQRGRIP